MHLLCSAPRSMCLGFLFWLARPGVTAFPSLQPSATFNRQHLPASSAVPVLRAQLAERHEHGSQPVPGQCPRECPQQQHPGLRLDDLLRCVPVGSEEASPAAMGFTGIESAQLCPAQPCGFFILA